MTRAFFRMLTFCTALAFAAPAAAQTVHLAVIVGLAGDPSVPNKLPENRCGQGAAE